MSVDSGRHAVLACITFCIKDTDMKAGKLKLWEYTYGFWSILHVLYAYVAVFLDVEQEMH